MLITRDIINDVRGRKRSPPSRIRTSDLRISIDKHLQSSALPTELSVVDAGGCAKGVTMYFNRSSFAEVLLSFTGLTLVSAPHLARSYQHLFPLEAFKEIETKTVIDLR